jgi:hypothetical protein
MKPANWGFAACAFPRLPLARDEDALVAAIGVTPPWERPGFSALLP